MGFFGVLAASGYIGNLELSNIQITGAGEVGGLVGLIDRAGGENIIITSGTVTGSDEYVGGVVGQSNGTDIDNSYTVGAITGSGIKVGDVAGETNRFVRMGYSAATVVGTSQVGGAIGHVDGLANLVGLFVTGSVAGTGGSTLVGKFFGTSGTVTFGNTCFWISSASDSTGSSGACNILGASAVADAADFYLSTNAPLTVWDITDYWQTVPGDFSRLIFETN